MMTDEIWPLAMRDTSCVYRILEFLLLGDDIVLSVLYGSGKRVEAIWLLEFQSRNLMHWR